MVQKVNLFWFRRDLRLDDNAGLYKALIAGLPVVPIFIFDTEILSQLEDRDDKRVSFIYTALEQMQVQLTNLSSSLDVRYGKPTEVFSKIIKDYSVEAVYANHDYEPYAIEREEAIQKLLAHDNIAFRTSKDQVVFERDEIVKDNGTGYMVFTPFSRKWKSVFTKEYIKAHESEKRLSACFKQKALPFPSLKKMGFSFNQDIPAVEAVNEDILKHYDKTRNIPSLQGTSRMGVHLRFGTISVRKLVAKALELNEVYLTELIWREFFMQVLWHHPRVVKEACKSEYDKIKWQNNEAEFKQWCEGKTGYPIVDAGMRELNATGFMHNRVRMIAGSFLVKDLLIDWRWGEAYFARKLLDFDLSSNNGNWQWVAGCGCDAAPYFRVFNPTLQAKKFDLKFEYILKWVPELNSQEYSKPIVEHEFAKQRCIQAYKEALYK